MNKKTKELIAKIGLGVGFITAIIILFILTKLLIFS